MNREEAVQADKETDPGVTVASVKDTDLPPGLPITEDAYLPGLAFDEMYQVGGEVRDHYGAVHTRLTTLSPEATTHYAPGGNFEYQEFDGGHEWRGDIAWAFLRKHL